MIVQDMGRCSFYILLSHAFITAGKLAGQQNAWEAQRADMREGI